MISNDNLPHERSNKVYNWNIIICEGSADLCSWETDICSTTFANCDVYID